MHFLIRTSYKQNLAVNPDFNTQIFAKKNIWDFGSVKNNIGK